MTESVPNTIDNTWIDGEISSQTDEELIFRGTTTGIKPTLTATFILVDDVWVFNKLESEGAPWGDPSAPGLALKNIEMGLMDAGYPINPHKAADDYEPNTT